MPDIQEMIAKAEARTDYLIAVRNLVAKHVMGMELDDDGEYYRMKDFTPHGWHWETTHAFSTEMGAAWMIIERLGEQGYHLHKLSGEHEGAWLCILAHPTDEGGTEYIKGWSEISPEVAICLAGLDALCVEVPHAP